MLKSRPQNLQYYVFNRVGVLQACFNPKLKPHQERVTFSVLRRQLEELKAEEVASKKNLSKRFMVYALGLCLSGNQSEANQALSLPGYLGCFHRMLPNRHRPGSCEVSSIPTVCNLYKKN